MKEFTRRQLSTSIILKIIVIISAISGTFLSAYAGRDSFMGGRNVFMYFTIQSNIGLAIICAIGLKKLLMGKSIKNSWYVVKLVGTVSITLTGIVFCFVLAPTMGAKAWNVQNILTHVLVPVLSIADFFVVAPHGSVRKRSILWVLLPPFLYAVYSGIAYAAGWQFSEGKTYPYFFLNWGSPAGAFGFSRELPFMGCMWWILSLLIFLIVVALGYLKVVDLIKKHSAKIN